MRLTLSIGPKYKGFHVAISYYITYVSYVTIIRAAWIHKKTGDHER